MLIPNVPCLSILACEIPYRRSFLLFTFILVFLSCLLHEHGVVLLVVDKNQLTFIGLGVFD